MGHNEEIQPQGKRVIYMRDDCAEVRGKYSSYSTRNNFEMKDCLGFAFFSNFALDLSGLLFQLSDFVLVTKRKWVRNALKFIAMR